MPKQLNVSLAFTADTSKATKEIASLQQSLTKLMNTAALESSSLGLTKDIKEATTAVAQLKAQLSGAMTSSGTLDLTKFNDSLKASKMSLEEYRTKLSALGPEGTQAFSQLASSIASAEIPLKRSNTLLQEFGTTLANTARWQLSSSLLHGFIGGLQSAYGYAQDLNESLNNIRIVTGQSTEQMAQLAEKANKAARELSTRTTDYTNASLIYYQQGLDDKAVEERTRTTLKLANVSRQSAEEVSDQMTAIWNNFDNGTKSLEYYADAITALGAKTASSSSEIAEGLSKFAAVADTIGLSYETATAALATVVAETRQSADTVGNAFKSIFSRIQSLKLGETLEDGVGLTKYTEALQKVGVDVLDMNGNLREADDILNDLGERWNDISKAQQTALAQTVAGQRQYTQFIALIDNWDKVKENTDIAANSEGTLQEQADIYAESWEASAKRVQAAAESIYDALISDDFFIGFNNLLTGLLDRVNDLIKGLGGIPGVLTTIGALMTATFGDKIANKINTIVKDFQAMSAKGIASTQELQSKAIKQLEIASNSYNGSTGAIAQTEQKALASQASLQKALFENQSNYNEEQLKTAQYLLDQNEALREQARLSAKNAEQQQEKTNTAERRFLSDFNDKSSGDSEDTFQITENVSDYVESLRICNEQQTLVSNSAQTLNGILVGTFESPKEQAEAFEKEIDNIMTSVNQLGSVPGLENFAVDVQIAFDAFKRDPSQSNMQDFITALTELGNQANIAGGQIEDSLIVETEKVEKKAGDGAKRVRELADTYKANGEAAVDLANKTSVMGTNAENTGKKLKEMGSNALDSGQMITGLASDLMAIASVINQVRSAWDTLNNENMTWGERALQIIPSLLMVLATLARTLQGLGGDALLAMTKHIPFIATLEAEAAAATHATLATLGLKAAILVGIGAAIAGAVVLIGQLIKVIDNAFETASERAERLAEDVKKTNKVYEDTKTAVEELKTAFDSYDEARAALDSCKEGTEEWYDALNNVNDKVLELLEKYPQLAQYLTFGDNGELGFSQEGIDAVQKEQTDNAIAAAVSKNEAALNQQQDQVDRERSKLVESYVTELSNIDEIYEIIGSKGEIIGKSIDEVANNLADGTITLEDVFGEFENLDPENLDIDQMIKDTAIALKDGIGAFNDYTETDIQDMDSEKILSLLGSEPGWLGMKNSTIFAGKENDEIKQMIQDAAIEEASGMKTQWASIQAAQSSYEASLVGLTNTQEAYSRSVGKQIISQNEDLKENPYFEQIQGMSGRLFDQIYENQKENYKETDTEILGEDFIKYVQEHNVEGYYGNLKATKDGVTYEDENGDSQTATRTQMLAEIAAAEAIDLMGNAAENVAATFKELEESGDDADKALSDFLSTKSISRKGKALEDVLKEDYGYNKEAGINDENNRAAAEKYLASKLGDKDEELTEQEASENGFATKDILIDNFLQGLEDYDARVEDAKDTGSKFVNRYVDKIGDAVDDLSTDEMEQVGNLLKKSMEATGFAGINAMKDVLAASGDNLSDTLGLLSSDDINWETISVEELSDQLKRVGVEADLISEDSLQNLINSMKQIDEISFESATSTFATLHDIIDGLEKGDKVKAEDYQTLLDFMGEDVLDDFFAPMADGTYKLIGDAEEFYNTVNGRSLEEFKQGYIQETQKVANIEDLKARYSEDNAKDLYDKVDFDKNGYEGENEQKIRDQLTYLDAVGAQSVTIDVEGKEELISVQEILADLDENGKLNINSYTALVELLKQYGGQWDKVNEGEKEAEQNAEAYKTMIASAAPDLESLHKIFTDEKNSEFFENNGIAFEDLVEQWKLFNSEDEIKETIKTLEDFNNATSEVDGFKALEDGNKADLWHELKDQISLTIDDLDEFIAMEDEISDEDFSEGIKELAGQATNIEELNKVLDAAGDEAIDLTDDIIRVLNQDDMTTEERIDAIIEKLIKGQGEAKKLSEYLMEQYKDNDSEQTTRQKILEMQEGARSSKETIMASDEYKENEKTEEGKAENQKRLNAIDNAAGLEIIDYAKNATDLLDTDRIAYFEQGLDLIVDKSQLSELELQNLGEAAASVYKDIDFLDTEDKINHIVDAFRDVNGNIPIDSVGTLTSIVTELVSEADDLSLEQKFEGIKELCEELQVPSENVASLMMQIFDAGKSDSTYTALSQLLSLYNTGLISYQDMAKEQMNMLDSSDEYSATQKAQIHDDLQLQQSELKTSAMNTLNSANLQTDFMGDIDYENPEKYASGLEVLANKAQQGDETLQNLFNTIGIDGTHALQDMEHYIEEGGSYADLAESIHEVFTADYGIDEDLGLEILNAAENLDQLNEAANNGWLDKVSSGDISDKALALSDNFETLNKALESGLITDVTKLNEKLDELYNDILEDSDIDVGELEDFTDELQELAGTSKAASKGLSGLSKDIKDNDKEAKTIASDIMRYANAVEDVKDNYDDWAKAIETANKAGKGMEGLAPNSTEVKQINAAKNAMSDMLGLDAGTLSDEFATSADNLNLMQDAANGVDGAYDQLMANAQQDIESNVSVDLDDTGFWDKKQEVQQAMDDMNFEDIEVGASIDDENFLQSLTDMVNAAGMTADQATSYLATMGVDAEVKETEVNSDETQEATGWTVTPQTEKVHVHIPQFRSQTSDKESIVSSAGAFDDDIEYGGFSVEPQTETQTTTKQTKAMALEVTSANKSSGGGFKKSASSGGGSGGGGGRGSCFASGTLVSIQEGFKNIEDIEIGDIVLSYNQETKKNEYSKVLQTMVHFTTEDIYTLYIENDKLNVTGIHKFLIIKNGEEEWIEASKLQINDLVLFADGTLHIINQIDIEEKSLIVYNFEVSNNHNYYVGKNQILVHNKGGGRRGGGGRSRATTTTKRATSEHEHNEERYRPVVQQLDKLNKAYSDTNSSKDHLFGKQHLKAIQNEIDITDKLIKKQEAYRKEIQKNLEQDIKNIKNQEQVDAKNAQKWGNASYTQSETIKTGKNKAKTTETTAYAAADAYSATGENLEADIKNGTIVNYNDLVAKADEHFNEIADDYAAHYDENLKYNGKNLKKVQANEALKNKYEQAKAVHDQFLANLQQLEETLKLQAEQITQAIEYEIQQIQNKIDAAVYEVDIKLDIDDTSLELINFQLEMMSDSGRDAARQIAKIGEQLDITADEYVQNNKAMANILSTVAKNENTKYITDNSGTKQYFNDDTKTTDASKYLDGEQLIKDMQSNDEETRQKAINEITHAAALKTDQLDEWTERATKNLSLVQKMQQDYLSIYDTLSSNINYWNEQMDNTIDKQQHLNTLVQGYKNVIDLIGKTQFYQDRAKGRDLEKKIDEGLITAANATYSTYKTQADQAKKTLEELKEQQEKAKENMNNEKLSEEARTRWGNIYDKYSDMVKEQQSVYYTASENAQSAFEDALQTNLDAYTNAMERAVEKFQESMAGTAVSLDYLADALDRKQQVQDRYLASYEKVHQLREMELEAEKSINEASNPKIKRELLAIQDEITSRQQDGKEATEYELKYLKQRLELKQAEAALEDAQKAKTQVSLTRDNEGNYGYVYTASDEDVADAEQNYADKIYEMQKANQEYITDLQNQAVQIEQEYYQKIQEINSDNGLTEEERRTKLDEINSDYNALHEAITDNLAYALNASQDIFGQYSENYAAITGDLTATNLSYVGSFDDTILSLETDYKTLEDYTKAWANSSGAYIEEMKSALKSYSDANAETMKAAGTDMENYAKQVEEDVSGEKGMVAQIKSFSTEMETMASEAEKAFDATLGAVTSIQEQFINSLEEMEQEITNLIDSLTEAKELMEEIDATNGVNGRDANGVDDTGSRKTGSATGSGGGSSSKGRSVTFTRRRNLRNGRFRASRGRRVTVAVAKRVLSNRAQRRVTRGIRSRRAQNAALKRAAKTKIAKILKKKKKYTVQYDTGGYTGDWSGNEGRLAMLHSKELVLNQQDTSNILTSVGVIRDLSNKIDLNALASSGALSNINSAGVGNLNNELEQHVQIEANFPNATSREEIQAAFENLIGLASQYANRQTI